MKDPEDDYWEIKVKSADDTLNSRKFSKKGTNTRQVKMKNSIKTIKFPVDEFKNREH